jgi:hypothetical protein
MSAIAKLRPVLSVLFMLENSVEVVSNISKGKSVSCCLCVALLSEVSLLTLSRVVEQPIPDLQSSC